MPHLQIYGPHLRHKVSHFIFMAHLLHLLTKLALAVVLYKTLCNDLRGLVTVDGFVRSEEKLIQQYLGQQK